MKINERGAGAIAARLEHAPANEHALQRADEWPPDADQGAAD